MGSDWKSVVASAVERHRERPGALLPILHDVQHHLGHVPPDAIPEIALALNLSRAEVHGVVTFYHDFRETPRGRVTVKLCRAESCQAVGGDALADHVKKRLGVDFHGTSADGAYTLEPVYCLGNCALSPAALIGDKPHGRLTPARFDALVDAAAGAAADAAVGSR